MSATARVIDADTLRRIETVYAGVRMLERESEERPTLRGVVWRLLQEAMETQKAISRPGPRGDVSCMPEVFHTAGEIFATEVEMAKDGISYAPKLHHVAGADQLDRYEEVMGWLRYIRARNVTRARQTVLFLAHGATPRRVADILGWPTARAAEAARYRAISSILERLRRDLPRDIER